MISVREAAFDIFRSHHLTTVFGNPGSTELPMIAGLPPDFRYVLGLQEGVVVGMADGYARAGAGLAADGRLDGPGQGRAGTGPRRAAGQRRSRR